ncbi:hypothetical protein DLAC_09038 [Tieghemostelium lacteum]|uniref:Uncharacterized protein n=1 Tax=Tieghemostelium lacteum TaxID=361077 RepID=A0A151Z905_TIELA|nr:hypothetical protein DLAC_09038 [Tieghemostelium lacteum]|eukprot:KYQ90419.1 hypothetical protein DLAC_09038 [Tieghemostelium lacteum]
MNLPKYLILLILKKLINHYPKYQIFYIYKIISTLELVSKEWKELVKRIPIKCRVLNKQTTLEVNRLLEKGQNVRLSLHPDGIEPIRSMVSNLDDTLSQITFNYDHYKLKDNLREYSNTLKSLYIVNGRTETIESTRALFESAPFHNFNSLELEFSSFSSDQMDLYPLLDSIDKSTSNGLRKFKFVNGSPDEVLLKGLEYTCQYRSLSKLLLVRINIDMSSLSKLIIDSLSLDDLLINKISIVTTTIVDNDSKLKFPFKKLQPFPDPYDHLLQNVINKNHSLRTLKIFGTESVRYSSLVEMLNNNSTIRILHFSVKSASYSSTADEHLSIKNETVQQILLSFNQQVDTLPYIYHLWKGPSVVRDAKITMDTWPLISRYHKSLKFVSFTIQDENIEFFCQLIRSNFQGLTSIRNLGITCKSSKLLESLVKALAHNNHLEKITFYSYPITDKVLNQFIQLNHPTIKIFQANLGGSLHINNLKKSLSTNNTLEKLNIMDISSPKTSVQKYYSSLFKILEKNQTLTFLSLPSPIINDKSSKDISTKLNNILSKNQSLVTLSLNLTEKKLINRSSGKVILF